MGLSSKLARISGPPVSKAEQEGAPDANKAQTLEGLRERMREILGRQARPESAAAVRAPQVDPTTTELPFTLIETEHGGLCVRRETLPRSYRVGRMGTSGAYRGNPELLGLLALDPEVARAPIEGALYLDTETTGLGAGAGTVAFLVGLAWFDAGGELVLEQFLLRSPGEEPAMLEALRQRVVDATVLVSFNGKSFDWPLLQGRFVMNRLPQPPKRPHLDLLHVGRRLHKSRIGNCRLQALEAHILGFERDGDIDGAECGPRYAHFLRTGDADALRGVVDHNLWDVASMVALVALYGEPLETLHREDLVGVASTLKRARELDRAMQVADVAIARGAGPEARRVRAHIAKARGDKARALADFEQLARDIDEASVRLELAKLYEHHLKQPGRALDWVALGTGEGEAAHTKRVSRLEKKLQRQRERMLRPLKRRRVAGG